MLQRALYLFGSHPHSGRKDRFIEKEKCGFQKHLCLQVEVAVAVTGFFKPIEQGTLDSHGVPQISPGLLDDRVYALESKTGHLTEAVGTFPYQSDAVRAKKLIDLHGRIRRDFERRQNRHKIPHDFALRIAGFDVLQPFLRDTTDLQQPIRRFFNDLQGADAETLDNRLGGSWPDPAQQPG